jgi:hypothetical protein
MRMLLKAVIDTAAGSEAIRNGTLPKIIQGTVEQLKPQAVYFAPEDGQRAMFMVFDLADPSQLPPVSEPLFSAGARVTLVPCMDLDDLQKGLSQLQA